MNRSLTLLGGFTAIVAAGLLTGSLVMSRVGSQTAAAVPAATVSYENLHGIGVLVPDDDPTGLVFLVSDTGGINDADRDLAARLVDAGLIVMPVDLDRWRSELEAGAEPGDECLYLGSDIEGIAKETLRTLALDTYFHPVVVGRGAGATFAYASVADAPDATVAGGVGLRATPSVRSRLPVCEGAKATPAAGGTFAYDRAAAIPNPFTFVDAEGTDKATALAAPFQAGTVIERDGDSAADDAVAAAVAIAAADSNGLPIVVSKPKGDPVAVAIFVSGDGGWRDLDKTIGDWLTAHGVEVIGVDALRYFWSEKTPEEMAADIATMLGDANPKAGVPVALLGYSFGADTLPFAYGHLPQAWTDKISLIGLLAPSQQTGFQISVGGWLGLSTGDHAVVPAIQTMPPPKVLCVYGTEDEEDNACLDPALASVTKLGIEGGHHFDGNYDAMAERILAAIRGGPAAALSAPVAPTSNP
ncbi:virulence factor family protein [Aureimonas pseudogalii]|uniref:Type IV secretory pathway VirJ component n=1 Tax=Aureimonas pseudogalii TaxID=1744844 RepID=A0A7W6H5J8_9HYPH|nr:AcvB/VirJ family lysyl-phosphatidylglycerol hydrolase [Aureimonas pseudogalii]MBB3998975.1 type IV secretory pathway VirJ component [Aureimonas pseudogalii]